jgi:hypothetical protein
MFLMDLGTGIWAIIAIAAVAAWFEDRIDSRRAAELFEMRSRVQRSEPVEESRPHESKHFTDSTPYDITKAIQ